MDDKCTAFLVGHSFIRRLQSWCAPRSLLNLNLDPNRVQIYWYGEGGATIANETHSKCIGSTASMVRDLEADIVFVDIGSNDLCNPALHPAKLVDYILSFANSLIAHGCRCVILSEILHRQSAYSYNLRVDATNALLQQFCLSVPNMVFWKHSRQNFNKRFLTNFVAADGIHVDQSVGMPKYYVSVRGAILYAEKLLKSP